MNYDSEVELWNEIFYDDKEFIRKYFDIFLDRETFFFKSENSTLISSLIACKYHWFWNEKSLNFAYLSGIMTRQDYRNKGYCSMLIDDCLTKLYSNGVLLSGLIAANEDLIPYYERKGFVSCCKYEKEIFARRKVDVELMDKYLFIKNIDITLPRYRQFFACIDNAVMHDERTLSLYGDGGYESFALVRNGCVMAVAVGKNNERYRKNVFYELLHISYVNMEAKTALLSFVSKKIRRDVIYTCKLDNISGNHNSLNAKTNMMRIINARNILEVMALRHYDEDICLNIRDETIPENNITVRIVEGEVRNIIPNPKLEVRTAKNAITYLSINELTQRLFDGGYMFLMLDR